MITDMKKEKLILKNSRLETGSLFLSSADVEVVINATPETIRFATISHNLDLPIGGLLQNTRSSILPMSTWCESLMKSVTRLPASWVADSSPPFAL